MKKILTLTLILTAFGFSANAQCPVNDSTSMGGGLTPNDVFYSFTNHTVATVLNNNWHMAFSVTGTDFPNGNYANGVAIRVNSGGIPGTVLKKLNGANAANWRAIDTTGLYALPQLLDSDSTWNLSAFTSGYKSSDILNFIWGNYSMTSHNVTGNNVFVLYNKTAGWYKKVFIKSLDYDTIWNVVISNVDNSDSSYLTINKKSYTNKLFVYYDVLNKLVIDREPVKSSWDLLWTKYVTYAVTPQGSGLSPVTGVLSNPAVKVEQNIGKRCSDVWLTNRTSAVDPSISAMGHDWKMLNMSFTYDMRDSNVYFVHAQNGKIYEMTFLSYQGGSAGKSRFNMYEATTGISDIDAKYAFNVYPNPNNGLLSVESDMVISGITFVDMQGKTVYTNNGAGTIDISGLANGIYVITVQTSEGVYHRRIIKE